jgi:uncharacterized membrane protein
LHEQLPEIVSATMAFSVVGLMWLNNYYRSSLIARVDLMHLVLTLGAAGTIVFIPFSTRALAEYWMYPWGIVLFSWNVCLAILFYVAATHHYVRFLVPKQVDRRFLRQNIFYSWVFAAISGVFVPALAIVNTTAALVCIPLVMVASVVSMFRMQPQFITAYRGVALHGEDDLRVSET